MNSPRVANRKMKNNQNHKILYKENREMAATNLFSTRVGFRVGVFVLGSYNKLAIKCKIILFQF